MIELAWRMVRTSPRWGGHYHRLEARLGAKKAIVAIARRLLCVIFALLRTGQKYALALEAPASCRSNSPGDTCPSGRIRLRVGAPPILPHKIAGLPWSLRRFPFSRPTRGDPSARSRG